MRCIIFCDTSWLEQNRTWWERVILFDSLRHCYQSVEGREVQYISYLRLSLNIPVSLAWPCQFLGHGSIWGVWSLPTRLEAFHQQLSLRLLQLFVTSEVWRGFRIVCSNCKQVAVCVRAEKRIMCLPVLISLWHSFTDGYFHNTSILNNPPGNNIYPVFLLYQKRGHLLSHITSFTIFLNLRSLFDCKCHPFYQ